MVMFLLMSALIREIKGGHGKTGHQTACLVVHPASRHLVPLYKRQVLEHSGGLVRKWQTLQPGIGSPRVLIDDTLRNLSTVAVPWLRVIRSALTVAVSFVTRTGLTTELNWPKSCCACFSTSRPPSRMGSSGEIFWLQRQHMHTVQTLDPLPNGQAQSTVERCQ